MCRRRSSGGASLGGGAGLAGGVAGRQRRGRRNRPRCGHRRGRAYRTGALGRRWTGDRTQRRRTLRRRRRWRRVFRPLAFGSVPFRHRTLGSGPRGNRLRRRGLDRRRLSQRGPRWGRQRRRRPFGRRPRRHRARRHHLVGARSLGARQDGSGRAGPLCVGHRQARDHRRRRWPGNACSARTALIAWPVAPSLLLRLATPFAWPAARLHSRWALWQRRPRRRGVAGHGQRAPPVAARPG